jgi:hypothetical protein
LTNWGEGTGKTGKRIFKMNSLNNNKKKRNKVEEIH